MIEIVSAILVKHGRILLQQRPALKDFGFSWESPGGKVETAAGRNESHHQALRRELHEELGIDIGILPDGQRPAWTGTFENMVTRSDRVGVVLHFYAISDRFTGVPTVREGQPGMGWFLSDEMLCLYLSPANERAKHEITQVMRREGIR